MIGSPSLFRERYGNTNNDDHHPSTTHDDDDDDDGAIQDPSNHSPSASVQRLLLLDARRRRRSTGKVPIRTSSIGNNREVIELTMVVWIPVTELSQRRFELPPRHVEFAILVDTHADVDIVRHELSLLLPQKQQSSSWNVSAIFVDSPELWTTGTTNQKHSLPLHHSKDEKDDNDDEDQHTPSRNQLLSSSVNNTATSITFIPQPRLWEPDSMVADLFFPTILQQLQQQQQQQHVQNRDSPRRIQISIVDLGAGIGRDACYLAEQCQSSTTVMLSSSSTTDVKIWALDQRYRTTDNSLQNDDNDNPTRQFWNRRGVGDALAQCVTMDLNNVERVFEFVSSLLLPEQNSTSPHDNDPNHHHHILCIYAVRFYHRPLLRALWEAVPTGTLFGISHFVQISDPWNSKYCSPKASKVLSSPNELRNALADETSQPSWTILHDRIEWEHAQAGGRPLQQIVAIKKGK
jgi:hypothetical protein